MDLRQAAEQVLNNSAFKVAMASLKDDALQDLLSTSVDSPIGLVNARMKYDATLMVEYELERILRSRITNPEF